MRKEKFERTKPHVNKGTIGHGKTVTRKGSALKKGITLGRGKVALAFAVRGGIRVFLPLKGAEQEVRLLKIKRKKGELGRNAEFSFKSPGKAREAFEGVVDILKLAGARLERGEGAFYLGDTEVEGTWIDLPGSFYNIARQGLIALGGRKRKAKKSSSKKGGVQEKKPVTSPKQQANKPVVDQAPVDVPDEWLLFS